jgi:hypothetical protein
MGSEYDPLFARRGAPAEGRDLERAEELFTTAGEPYLRSPWSWVLWAVVLPSTALATARAARRGMLAVLLLWSGAVLLGGAVEAALILRDRRPRTALAAWVLRAQGNLSLVAVALSVVLVAGRLSWALPGLWLLLVGHSFLTLGGLSFPPLRRTGWLYQCAGVVALVPRARPLWVFAAATAAGNAFVAWSLARRQRATRTARDATARSPGP